MRKGAEVWYLMVLIDSDLRTFGRMAIGRPVGLLGSGSPYTVLLDDIRVSRLASSRPSRSRSPTRTSSAATPRKTTRARMARPVTGELHFAPVDYSPLREQMLRLRTLRGWDQPRLAELTGSNQSLVSQVERGRKDPTEEFVKCVANAFGVSVSFPLLPGCRTPSGPFSQLRRAGPGPCRLVSGRSDSAASKQTARTCRIARAACRRRLHPAQGACPGLEAD